MGAYAVYSDKPFRANGEIKRKRKRGRIDDLMELMENASICFDEKTQRTVLVKNGNIVGVFKEDDDK